MLSREPSNYWFLNNTIAETFSYYKDVFTEEELDKIITLSDSFPSEEAYIVGEESKNEVDKTTRQTEIKWFKVTPDAEWLYRKLTDIINDANDRYFGFELLYMESLQYSVYKKGDFYKEHVDMMYSSVGVPRKLSFSLQLTDETKYEGGDLIIKTGDNAPAPRSKGTITLFPSYILHEVTPVTKGTRKALVGWVSGPPFR